MRYPVVNLGLTEAEWKKDWDAFKEKVQPPPPTYGTPPPPPTVLNTLPRGLSDGQIEKICDLVDTANTSSSERDRKDAADTIRKWMESLPGDAQDPASDKGTMKRYIDRYCKNGLAFLQKYQPDIPVAPAVPTPAKYEFPPVATPGLKPLQPTGAPVASPRAYGPLIPEPVVTPSTLTNVVPQNILDALCQAVKAFLEDPSAENVYASAIKELMARYPGQSWNIIQYLQRNCYPDISTLMDRIEQKPYIPSGQTPSEDKFKKKPEPTPVVERPPVPTPTSQRPNVPTLPTVPVQGAEVATANPYDLTPRFTEQGNQYSMVPEEMRQDVATGQGGCPVGQFPAYPGGPCRGSIAPGFSNLVNQAMNLAPSGITTPTTFGADAYSGGGGMYSGIGRRFPIMNL